MFYTNIRSMSNLCRMRPTIEPVKRIATVQISRAAARYGEHAPMATACCNACRTCVQTNLLGVALGAAAAAGVALKRLARRSVPAA